MRIGSDPFLDVRPKLQPTHSALEARLNNEPDKDKSMSGDLFKIVFEASSKAFDEASAVSRANTAKLLTGQIEDLPSYIIEGEKPGILFELNLNVRNKLLDAYSEIMKTQV